MIEQPCLHVISTSTVRGHVLPYRAHIKLQQQSGVTEIVDGVHIEFDHEKCSLRAQEWMTALSPGEEQALYDAVCHEALAVYNMKRFKGESIDGAPRHS